MRYCFAFFLLFVSSVSSQTLMKQAIDHYENGRYSKALPMFQQQLAQQKGDPIILEYLGDIAGYTEQYDDAIEIFEKLAMQFPANANYHFKLGGTLGMKALSLSKIRAVSYISDIKYHLEQAARLDPSHIETRWALVELYVQLPRIIGGGEDKAIVYAKELERISPVDGYLSQGYIAEYSQRPKDAEHYYKKAIAVGGSPHTYEKLATHYENNAQPEQAILTVEESLKIHPRNQLNYQIGKVAAQYNVATERGIQCLKIYLANHSAADRVPKDWAYYRLAQIYRHHGKKKIALQWIDLALSTRPDFEQALAEKQTILAL